LKYCRKRKGVKIRSGLALSARQVKTKDTDQACLLATAATADGRQDAHINQMRRRRRGSARLGAAAQADRTRACPAGLDNTTTARHRHRIDLAGRSLASSFFSLRPCSTAFRESLFLQLDPYIISRVNKA